MFKRGDDVCSDPTFTFLPSSLGIYQLFHLLTFADDVSKHVVIDLAYPLFSKVVAKKGPTFSAF